MSNRWFRFVIALLALAVAGAAGYRIHQNEQRLANDVSATRSALLAADNAIAMVSEIKAALHAYVAAGQGHAFWTERAQGLIDALSASMLEVDAAATAVGTSLPEALDLLDRLDASEARAREHVKAGEALLAGDVVFNDARDHLDGLRLEIARGSDAIRQAADLRHTAIRRDEVMLGAGAAAVMALAILLLVAPTRADTATSTAPLSIAARDTANADDGIVSGPVVTKRTALGASSAARAESQDGHGPSTGSGALRVESRGSGSSSRRPASPESGRLAPGAPVAPIAPVGVPLAEAARLCTDLGKVADSTQLSSLLQRAANVLGASGLIVWMSSPDGRELYPVGSAGYEARMIARIGAIRRDSTNLTAAAFREAAPRSSAALGPAAAALATPLVGPQGPVGVLSAELRDILEVDAQSLAVAVIIAAQLSALLGTMTSTAAPVTVAPPQVHEAQA